MTARWMMVCALLGVGFGCTKDKPAASTASKTDNQRDAEFWRWVKEKLPELKKAQTGREPVIAELAKALESVDGRLGFELGMGQGDELELIVSADGDVKAFPVVERLVRSAAPIEGLKAIAFRPRKGPGFQLTVGERKVGFDDLWFEADKHPKPGLMALKVYVRDLPEAGSKSYVEPVMIMLDVALGEYDVATKVGSFELKPAPEKPLESLLPFKRLAEVADGWPVTPKG